ncbi:MAG: SDR family oxidoreductase [Planctomycetota bacterium]
MGASRGLGAAVAQHLSARGDHVLAVSRSPAIAGDWIQADVAEDAGLDTIVETIAGRDLDGVLYMGGTWERGAFTDEYDFLNSPRAETRHVIEVNLTAAILLVQALATNLQKAENPKVLLMGSMSGLPHTATREVANTAAMFGLQGAAEALQLALRKAKIGVSVINPGNMATPEVEQDIAEDRIGPQTPIALVELLRTVDYLLETGPTAVPTVINLNQLTG